MSRTILVSIIIPTKNEEKNIKRCLNSIKSQSYKNIEIIVVDNNSSDKTKNIARHYTKNVYDKNPERSTQRNYGAAKAKGKYLLFIDGDMIVTKNVIKECVDVAEATSAKGIVIPEKSIGEGFWARCKSLEKEFYLGVKWMEAARFYEKDAFLKVRGFNTKLISGEDWDLSQRIGKIYKLERIKNFILHNEGRLTLFETLKKKFYYAQHFRTYKNSESSKNNINKQTSIFFRYSLFFSKPDILLKNPIIGFGMFFMKTSEFIAGGIGSIYKK